jgi:hypothetical protein
MKIANLKLPQGKRAASGVLVALFELYQLIWPDLLSDQWENWIYKAIGILGTAGILDYLQRKYVTKTP